ncbi:hypothetical protein BAY61_18240 [Prauserella marina]|nr:hypothetical protein BAY61_18240 [Prauserella marina]
MTEFRISLQHMKAGQPLDVKEAFRSPSKISVHLVRSRRPTTRKLEAFQDEALVDSQRLGHRHCAQVLLGTPQVGWRHRARDQIS